jgi:heme/copper-type cytochrome/quinol oxidase subunit 2
MEATLMNKKTQDAHSNEKGMGMIMVLMFTAVLLILAATAFKISYSLHKQNQQAKVMLQKKANLLKIQK